MGGIKSPCGNGHTHSLVLGKYRSRTPVSNPASRVRRPRASPLGNLTTASHLARGLVRLRCVGQVALSLSSTKKQFFVSENEGSDQGMLLPSTVVRLPSGLARGRRTPEAPGSRPVLAQNQGVRVAIPAGAFYAPKKNTPQGVFVQLKCCFGGTRLPEPGEPAAGVGGTGRSCHTNRFL